MLIKIIIIYLLIINTAGFALMGLDKHKALKRKWRISESTLFKTAFAGGSPGIWIAMKCFHHKTRHKKFVQGIPAIFLLEALTVIALYIIIKIYF